MDYLVVSTAFWHPVVRAVSISRRPKTSDLVAFVGVWKSRREAIAEFPLLQQPWIVVIEQSAAPTVVYDASRGPEFPKAMKLLYKSDGAFGTAGGIFRSDKLQQDFVVTNFHVLCEDAQAPFDDIAAVWHSTEHSKKARIESIDGKCSVTVVPDSGAGRFCTRFGEIHDMAWLKVTPVLGPQLSASEAVSDKFRCPSILEWSTLQERLEKHLLAGRCPVVWKLGATTGLRFGLLRSLKDYDTHARGHQELITYDMTSDSGDSGSLVFCTESDSKGNRVHQLIALNGGRCKTITSNGAVIPYGFPFSRVLQVLSSHLNAPVRFHSFRYRSPAGKLEQWTKAGEPKTMALSVSLSPSSAVSLTPSSESSSASDPGDRKGTPADSPSSTSTSPTAISSPLANSSSNDPSTCDVKAFEALPLAASLLLPGSARSRCV